MSYEYKEILKVAARDFLAGNLEQDSETGEYLNLGEVEENYSDISIKIDHLYAQAAKADEYKAKAESFDRIVEERNQAGTDMYGKDDDVVDRVIERAFWNIDGIIVEYESGEYDAKKR